MRKMRKEPSEQLKQYFHLSWKDVILSIGTLFCTCMVCLLLFRISAGDSYVSMLFILAVFMIARFTDGFLCGILSSLIAVLAVNFIFTFPYFRFNFTLTGYPLTILSMLAVSITTSMLTSQAKQTEMARIEAEKEKTRSNLLRAISHDLRTPLTSISGSISAILENGAALTEQDRANLLRGAQADAQWLIRMVENLLTVTRIDGENQGSVIKVPESVEDILSGAIAKFHKRFPGIQVKVQIPEECLWIPVDVVLIEQVLLNLMENAAIHGQSTTRIVLSVSEESGKALFCVQDNGKGIDPAKLPRLFDGHLMSSSEPVGDSKRNMGIGLSVCNAIIRAHGGTMRGSNNPAGGATFEFLLDL